MSRSTLALVVHHLRAKLACQERSEKSDEQLLHAFTTHHNDASFAVLVHRHGPMVLHVCRRVLGQEQDAEDAFQATFLVLARKAALLRRKSALASWLHGVAYRIALKAKQSAERRRKYEGRAQVRSSVDPTDELLWREIRALFDEEIARLPEKYRSVFVLCCLEELSQAEAGRHLGLKEGTVANRLAEARKRLAQRLRCRGVELTAVLAISGLAAQSASALPAALVAATMKSVLASVAGERLAGIVSSSVAQLVKSATAAMAVNKAKIATALLLTASMLAGASAWAYRGLAANVLTPTVQPTNLPAKANDKLKSDASKPETAKSVEIQGRIVDPDGKPVLGAKLLFLFNFNPHFYSHYANKFPNKIWARSGAKGQFRFSVPADPLDDTSLGSPWEMSYVLATAEGYGFAAAELGKPGVTDLMVRLVKDDKPICGRILNLEGKPVAGARVRIADSLSIPKKDDLTTWLAAFKNNPDEDPYQVDWTHLTELHSSAFDLLIPPVTTGIDGRFQIKGIGRERLARLRIEGPTIATQVITVQTRSQEAIHVQRSASPKPQTHTYYGARLEILAGPTRPVVGVVRDKDTGKPLAGVTVETEIGQWEFIRTTTDKDGRYRLAGLPKEGSQIMAVTNDRPYLPAIRTFEDTPGLETITFDFTMKRGVWVKGRVFDKATGQPQWANVEYHCFVDNPNANGVGSLHPNQRIKVTRKDGSFQIPVLPGRGVITAFAIAEGSDSYVQGAGADKIKGFNPLKLIPGDPCLLVNQHTLVEINAKPDAESITCDLPLDPGRTLAGKIVGPDGKPLAGARVCGLNDRGYWGHDSLSGADFTVMALEPNKPRLLQFVHEGKKLAGFLRLRGNEKAPLQVRLDQRWGTLTGRLVRPDGKPIAGAITACYVSGEKHHGDIQYESLQFVLPVRSDKNGRFCIEGLASGLKYELHFFKPLFYDLDIVGGRLKELTIKPGETKDLGDLTVKPME
jgi:RNA polymerase sigma factor (sigma-70 family)